uniref:Uncharacterized protein n=1 Tax=Arundo donax TaxID=35708 RepID=A0A0A9ADG3_ARUDO
MVGFLVILDRSNDEHEIGPTD